MKPYYLCILFITLFISCSDSNDITDSNISNQRVISVIDDSSEAINYANPHDYAGQIHQELLTTYYNADGLPFTLSGIITTATTVANANDSFMSLTKNAPYHFGYADRVTYIVSQPVGFQDAIINESIQDSDARSSFKTFVTELLLACEEEDDFSVLYDSIVAYEEAVYNDSSLTNHDKQTILITTSITRHSVYARKKKPKKDKDPEWQYMVGNIFAALDGADNSVEDAIMKGLVTGIVENTK